MCFMAADQELFQSRWFSEEIGQSQELCDKCNLAVGLNGLLLRGLTVSMQHFITFNSAVCGVWSMTVCCGWPQLANTAESYRTEMVTLKMQMNNHDRYATIYLLSSPAFKRNQPITFQAAKILQVDLHREVQDIVTFLLFYWVLFNILATLIEDFLRD